MDASCRENRCQEVFRNATVLPTMQMISYESKRELVAALLSAFGIGSKLPCAFGGVGGGISNNSLPK